MQSSDVDLGAKTYSEVSDRFGFLRNLTKMGVVGPRDMQHTTENCVKLYSLDLVDSLWKELIQFGGLVAETLTGDLEHEVSPEATMYQTLIKRTLRNPFPNVEVLLRIYLTLIISNCS